MAHSNSSDYVIGNMDIKEQTNTFSAFINYSIWGGALVALSIFGLVLVFGAHIPWLGAVLSIVALGAIIGKVLKLGVKWYISIGVVAALSIAIYIFSGLTNALIGMFN